MKLKAPVKHLLVDLDGTLLGNRNIALSADFVFQILGALTKYTGLRSAAKLLFAAQQVFSLPSPLATNDIRVVEIVARELGIAVDEARKLVKDLLGGIFPSLEKHFYPMPGAKDFLLWAKDRFPLTLATNPVWPIEIIELRVRWAGVDPSIFSAITHAKQMHACKPSPEYYEEVLAQQGLKAEECLLLGNDVKMDLPATKVGVRVFIVGDFKKVSPLHFKNGKADAWKGSFHHLQSALEKSASGNA
jgi:FMN phosphatase YigB (HAD superfamily)